MAKKRKTPGSPGKGVSGLEKVIRMVVSEELDKRMQSEHPFPSPNFPANPEQRVREQNDTEPSVTNEWMDNWFAPVPESEPAARPSRPESRRRGDKKISESPMWTAMEQDGPVRWESPAAEREARKPEPSRRDPMEVWPEVYDETVSLKSVRGKKGSGRHGR